MTSLFSAIKKAIAPNYTRQIAQFAAMGFDAQKAEEYINKYEGDMDLAIEHLLKDKRKRKKNAKKLKKANISNGHKKEQSEHSTNENIKQSQSNSEQNNQQIQKPNELKIHCKCGVKMTLIQPSQCKISIGLQCNNKKCVKSIKKNEWFYHCITNSSNTKFHKGPYNYCIKCANLKVKLLHKQMIENHNEEMKEYKVNNEWTPNDIYDIIHKAKSKINLPKFEFLNNSKPQTIEEKYNLTNKQMELLYLIPDDMQKHAAIWIKATNANSKLMHEYSEMCKELFQNIHMDQFPHFAVFGCDSIQFEQLPISQRFGLQRILVILATYHVSLTYCPQIVHLIGVLLNKIDEKCVFALCHSMLNASKGSKMERNMYFTFNYVRNCIRIQTLLSLIDNNVKMVSIYLKQNKINIKDLITNAMESMFIAYLNEETYLTLIDKFFEKGYSILFKFAISLIKNCQKELIQTKNLPQFKNALIKYSKTVIPDDLNSFFFMVHIWNFGDNSVENLEELHKNNRENYLNEPKGQNLIRLWPEWDFNKINATKTKIFTSKWMYYQVWCWLPQQCHLGEFELIFNAETDGYKLMSLYYYCMNHENLIILIKTKMNEIFGAFVTSIGHEQHWKNFLSDHKAFIFVLKSNKNWIKKIEYFDCVLSVLPTKNSLSIGYKNFNLIFIDEALKHGFSDACKKLKSPSLSSQENGEFDIASIEVWSVEHEIHKKRRKKESIHSLCENHLQRLSTVLFGGRQHNHSQYSSF
eukprot:111338_1